MPVHDVSYEWFIKAFSILRYSRSESGFIPLTEMLAYADSFELIGTKFEFITIIRGLDISEKRYFEEKNKEPEDKEKEKG